MRAEARSQSLWAARLEVVGELASLINTTFDLDEIFRTAILKLRRVLEFRRASVVLVSDDREHYYLHTLFDAARGGFVRVEATYPVAQGLTGQAIQSGEAMRVDAFAGTDGIRTAGEENVSALIVPLHVDGQVIGTLNFGARESPTYADEDLELAVLLGRQIATSLYYSRLLATIEQQREAISREHARVQLERTRLEALIDASDIATLLISDERVTYANAPAAELLGLPQEIIVGSEMEEINRVLARSLRNPDALRRQVSALEGGDLPLHDRVEFDFPRPLVCQRTVTAVRNEHGEVFAHLVLFRDVTREAEAEAAKSEFVSLVSHELRTPLTSVKTSVNLVLRGAAGSLSEKASDLLDIALRNLDRLIRLVDDLLDLSRIESGRVVTKLAPTSVREAGSRAVDSVSAFADERAVMIELDWPAEDLRVVADADRLQQVIVNLVSNAVKFSPAGGRVSLRAWRQGDRAVIEVSDEGPGIPAEHLQTIFDKFQQLERASTRRYGGAGLGLAISRTIVEQFGGDLWAESEPGRGSRFLVRLRLAEGEPEVAAAMQPGAPGDRSVFLVEGDPDLQRVLRAQFESEGWEVRVSEGGEGALGHPDLGALGVILVGLELGDMHGLEFLQRLRRLPSCADVPALLVGAGGDERQAVAYGADGWSAGDPDALIAEAQRLVERPRRRVVLLIEDDPAVRGALARTLRRGGFACLEAASGEAGIELARLRVPDLVITDVQIPGTDGLGVLREFREDPGLAGVPAVAITGHATPEVARGLVALRADLIGKPVDAQVLLAEVERLLGSGAPR